MIDSHPRFAPLQRLLHWLMAICILTMLFIGVGMVSTIMPKYVPLVVDSQIARHRHSGAGADPSGGAPALSAPRRCRLTCPSR